MTVKKAIYRCSICGNVVEVLDTGVGELVCCGQAMDKLEAQAVDSEGNEKHVPVVEKVIDGYKVRVGSIPHPMEESHYIEWIELSDGETCIRKYLKPNDEPEAIFYFQGDDVKARIYCNIHFMWES